MSRNVAVIGAGIIGSISAIELLRQGDAVTIIEPAEPGGEQAASYGNAAWLSSHSVIPPSEPGIWKKIPGYLADPLGPLAIRPGYLLRAAPWLARYLLSGCTLKRVEKIARSLRPLLMDAPKLHAKIAAEAGVDRLIDPTSGLMHVYTSRETFEAEALSWAIRRRVGIEWTELEGEEFRERQPQLHPRYRFGAFVGEAGHCKNPGAYVAALAAHAQKLGAHTVKAKARDFRIEGGRLKAVRTDAGEVLCGAAVVAAGAHSRPLAKAAGDSVPLDSERGYHVMIEDAQVGPATPIMVSDCKMVVTMLDRGLRAAGQVEIAGLAAAPNIARAEILKKHLLDILPGLPRDLDAEKISYWLGHRPSTPDGMPCLGASAASRDIVYAFGHGHVGLVSSARTGRVVAQLVAGRETEIPVDAFSPRRF